MYKEFISHLHNYAKAIRILTKRVSTNFISYTIKTERNFGMSEGNNN